MRKILSLVLALTLVLGSFSFAFAATPSDVEGTKYEDAVERLNVLGVLTGYPDGTFRPNDTITRAEFATVVVRALGYGLAAETVKEASVFTDVPANHWAAGFVNYAAKLGYVNGMGDGTFAPDSPVTYEQAITIIVRALGYEPAANSRGGYPYGYLSIAEENDITAGVDGVFGLAATRGTVAMLLDNSLEVPMMVQKGYGDIATYVVSGTDGTDEKTLLDDKLGLGKVEGQVVSVDTDDMELVVYKAKDGAYPSTEKEKYDVMDDIQIEGLENQIVKMWVKNGEVVTLDVVSDVKYDFISKLNGDAEADLPSEQVKDIETITLLNEGETYDVAVDDNDARIATFYENGSKLDRTDNFDNDVQFAKVIFRGEEVVCVEAYDLDPAGLIDTIKDDKLSYVVGDRTKTIRDLDDAKEMLVVINGELGTYEDLDEGMYFDYAEYTSDKYVIVATDKTVNGEFDRIDEDDAEIRVDGEYIGLAKKFYVSTNEGETYSSAKDNASDLSSLDSLFDTDVTAVLNNKGDIVYISSEVEEDTSTFYGFVVAKDDFDKQLRVEKVVDGAVEEVTYNVDIADSSDPVQFGNVNIYNSSASDTLQSKLDSFYEFTVDEDDVIVKIESISFTDYTGNEFNDKYDYIKASDNVYMDRAEIFDLTTFGNPDDDDVVEYLKWEDIEDTAGTSLGIVFKADGDRPYVVIITNNNNVGLGETQDYSVAFVVDRDKIGSTGYKYEYELATTDGVENYVAKTATAPDKVVVYDLISEEDGKIKIVAEAVYDRLTDIATDTDIPTGTFTAVDGVVKEDSVAGDYFTIGTTKYKVVSDTMIYEVVIDSDGNASYEEADLTDIDDEGTTRDHLYMLLEDGVVKVLFIKK